MCCPKEFLDAVKAGAKVITKSLPNGKYIRLAKRNGKWVAGEVKKKETK